MASLSLADYVVFGITLLTSSCIGIYYRFTGGQQKTTSEYLLANHEMSILPIAFSLMANFMSSITLLGVSAEIYMYGSMFAVINIANGLFTPVAAYLYLPVFFNLGAISVYEYLEIRFGRWARLAASLAFSCQMILYMGIVLYAPALAFEVVTGLSKMWSIILVGSVCTFYCAIGGLKAVVITDVFQSLLMYAAVFCVAISAWIDKGSLAKIWEIAEDHHRIEFDNFNLDPTVRHTWWSLTFGGSINYLSLYAVNQAQVQRYLSVKDLKTAQKALWWSWPLLVLLGLSTSFAGLAIFSRYADCDPLITGKISSADELMPYYVVDTMGHLPGLTGLFVSGIFSASLSTVSGAVNSLAAVTLEDYVKPFCNHVLKRNTRGRSGLFQAKLISVMYGCVCIALAFAVEHLGSILQAALTIFQVVGGPVLGLFSLGMFFPFANETGAVIGFLVSLIYLTWLGFTPFKPTNMKLPQSTSGCSGNYSLPMVSPTETSGENFFYLHRLSYLWLGLMGFILCLCVGTLMSFVASHVFHLHPVNQSDFIEPNLFAPPVASYLKRRQRNLCGSPAEKESIVIVQHTPVRKIDSEGECKTTFLQDPQACHRPIA